MTPFRPDADSAHKQEMCHYSFNPMNAITLHPISVTRVQCNEMMTNYVVQWFSTF